MVTYMYNLYIPNIDVVSMNQDTELLRKYHIIDVQTIITNSKQ